jgi:predicted kinase
MKPKIYVLVGMIASGKSTYCKQAAKHGKIILNDDAIVNMLHADDYTLYDKNLKLLYKSIENNVISLGLCAGRTVIIDRGLNVSKQGRKRWLAIAKSFDIECEAIILPKDTPEIHAERRYKSDSRGHSYEYWLRVANRHDSVYDEPTIEEGFDAVHSTSFIRITQGEII